MRRRIECFKGCFNSIFIVVLWTCCSCSDLNQIEIPVTDIVLSDSEVYMKMGETKSVRAMVYPDDATDKTVLWSSRNEPVVKVKNGKLTALKVGAATICAESKNGEVQAFCIVRVLYPNPVTGVSVDKSQIEMVVGEESFLEANVSPSDATIKNVTWTSSNPEIANVVDGKVMALKEGQALITVETEDGNKKAECKVIVNNISISLDKRNVTMYEGDGMLLNANLFPSYVTGIALKWISSDETVVSVENGFIIAKSVGKATISVLLEKGESEASCDVVVLSKPVEYIDEFGVNHGYGIVIGNQCWAPVNCGYHAEDFPYGKLYQWGRKYGQGLGASYDKGKVSFEQGGVSLSDGQHMNNADKFYVGNDWLYYSNDKLWNKGTESLPKKSEYDPCPKGWRVPVISELEELAKNHSDFIMLADGQRGMYFSGEYEYSESTSKIFFPALDHRDFDGGGQISIGFNGCYWSASPDGKDYALSLDFYYGGSVYLSLGRRRANGCSVRCVQE